MDNSLSPESISATSLKELQMTLANYCSFREPFTARTSVTSLQIRAVANEIMKRRYSPRHYFTEFCQSLVDIVSHY